MSRLILALSLAILALPMVASAQQAPTAPAPAQAAPGAPGAAATNVLGSHAHGRKWSVIELGVVFMQQAAYGVAHHPVRRRSGHAQHGYRNSGCRPIR